MKLKKGEYVERREFTSEDMELLAKANGIVCADGFSWYKNNCYGITPNGSFSMLFEYERVSNVTQKFKQWLKENKVDRIKVEFECDLVEAIILQSLIGAVSTKVFGRKYDELFKFTNLNLVDINGHISEAKTFTYFSFEKECRELASRARRKTVKVGDNEYYEDDLCNVDWEAYNAIREQLAKIKPVG